MQKKGKKTAENTIFYIILGILPFLAALICLGIGRYSMSVSETVTTLFSRFTNAKVDNTAYTVIFNVRLPRIILAAVVGAGLSCAGAAFQGLFSNPLATPDTLGVASGASFGAVLAMLIGGNMIGIQGMALIFGLISCLITFLIGRSSRRGSIVMIVLAGLVVSSVFEALVSLMKYVADPQDELPVITYWLMGSMSRANYKNLVMGIPFIVIGIIIIFALRWRLNILSFNEDEARSLGVNVKILRVAFILASSMITASCVSMCGQVGWVGLLVPHISRMMRGNNNCKVIPVSISLGAFFMIVMDTFARSATASEIPISILTAIIGAPVFIVLLKKTGGSWA
ncbi:iron ABC transporter permease [Roseburia sp. BX0805]|uniref:Iron ABC transporter permease n=1 Tax=Roseburia yibonii TaxID=2763063 RepID=A0ABR7IAD5_9FIRM|nr:iron ABC transporter permease [Roseburia yibonii]MBC5753903.1 iron ABC transporter permease [Roseburia yibonii]